MVFDFILLGQMLRIYNCRIKKCSEVQEALNADCHIGQTDSVICKGRFALKYLHIILVDVINI